VPLVDLSLDEWESRKDVIIVSQWLKVQGEVVREIHPAARLRRLMCGKPVAFRWPHISR
jgi:hypothetical protein